MWVDGYIDVKNFTDSAILFSQKKNEIEKGKKYWILESAGAGNVVAYFGELTNIINKIEPLTRTSIDAPKIYMFTVLNSASQYEKLVVNSSSEIYESYEKLSMYCGVNKISISYAWSAVVELHRQGLIREI